MTVNVKADTAKLDSMEAGMVSRLSAIVRAHAFMVEGAAKTSIMTGTKSGRVYARPGGKSHRASAPGEAPATDKGFLANSIRSAPEQGLTWRVSAGMGYAAPLELGSRRVAPRPFLAPALASVKASFVKAIERVFQ